MAGEAFRPFRDRTHAGRVLAERLTAYANRSDVVVLALPRGGVPVAFQVASVIRAPLDVFLVRKLGVPGQPELAMGAIASGGIRVLNDDVVRLLGLDQDVIERVAERESRELQRRERLYRADRPPPDLRNRIVILVDDGLATGSTMRAAAQSVREHAPDRVVVAVPTAPADTCEALKAEVDEVVCVSTPETFTAVGQSYEEFSQLTDVEVRDLLERGSRH